MNNVHESLWGWTENFMETINKLTHDLVDTVSNTFGLTFDSSNFILTDVLQQKLTAYFHECAALLSFDDFQLQLLKVFSFTFISTVALIFIAWHIYGPRISEQFMEPSKAIYILLLICTYVVVFFSLNEFIKRSLYIYRSE